MDHDGEEKKVLRRNVPTGNSCSCSHPVNTTFLIVWQEKKKVEGHFFNVNLKEMRKNPRKTVNFGFYLLFNIHVAIVTRRFTSKCLRVNFISWFSQTENKRI